MKRSELANFEGIWKQYALINSLVLVCVRRVCSVQAENTHRWGKHHCTAGLQFNKTENDQWKKYNFLYFVKQSNATL